MAALEVGRIIKNRYRVEAYLSGGAWQTFTKFTICNAAPIWL